MSELVQQTKAFLCLEGLHIVGEAHQQVSKVAVACGSAGQFIKQAMRVGCDCLVTGETNFHTCLEAKANNVALVLPGHYSSERFALEVLANVLKEEFSDVVIWPSKLECDPLTWA